MIRYLQAGVKTMNVSWNLLLHRIALRNIVFVLCLAFTKMLANEFTQEQEIRAIQYLDGLIKSQIDDEQREITFSDKPIPKSFCEEGIVLPTHERNGISNFINSASVGLGLMWSIANNQKELPKTFFLFDAGFLGLPSECANRQIFFGAKVRYEQGIDIVTNLDSVYRIGAEGYYHPQILNFKGHQIASLLLGFGYRFSHTNLDGGNYMDLGLLIYPSFPAHLSFVYRTDYANDTPTQHFLQVYVKIPLLFRF